MYELGSDIATILGDTYKKFREKEVNPILKSFDFLRYTPEVDKLIINPEPDIIIKTWFDNILEGIQVGIPENSFSEQEVMDVFTLTQKQLEYEWNEWNKIKSKGKGITDTPNKELPQNNTELSINLRKTKISGWFVMIPILKLFGI